MMHQRIIAICAIGLWLVGCQTKQQPMSREAKMQMDSAYRAQQAGQQDSSARLAAPAELQDTTIRRPTKSIGELGKRPVVDLLDTLEQLKQQPMEVEQISEMALFFLSSVDKRNPDAVDEAFHAFTAFQRSVADAAYEELAKDEQLMDQIQELAIEGAEPSPAANEYLQKMRNNGLRRVDAEGAVDFYPSITYAFQFFGKYLSQPMREYYIQISEEEQRAMASDGGLMISPMELADRIGFRAVFLKRYPDHALSAADGLARLEYQAMLPYLMMGLDNTPAFDFETQKLNDDFAKAIEYASQTYVEYEYGKIMKRYDQLLAQENEQKTDKVINFVNQYRP